MTAVPTTTNATGTAVSTGQEYDPYAAYGESASRGTGTLLKFAKGHWTAGKDAEAVAAGTKFYANMQGLKIGWQRWEDGKPSDSVMFAVTSDQKPPLRSSLGDQDKDLWELDKEGRPRDPWQFTNELPLVSMDGEELVFSASSKGGINAIGELCIAYSKGRKMKPPGAVPVIEIGTSSYKHSDKTYGLIYTPTLKLVDWIEGDVLPQAATDEPDPEPVKEPAPAPAPSKPAKTARF
ncbi:MAG TPA: hypothetical protein VFS74_11350 [Gemmatimonadales bacterium]|nr:hypothetical protein [Gemmatimonadales bacterium]